MNDEAAQTVTDGDEAAAVEVSEVEEPEGGRPSEAKLRKRAQAAEAQRDQLSERLVNLQRQQVESMLGDVKPEALWAAGVQLADLLCEDGTINAEAVSEAVEATRERLGIPKPPVGNFIPNIGSQPSGMAVVDRWAQAFGPKRG